MINKKTFLPSILVDGNTAGVDRCILFTANRFDVTSKFSGAIFGNCLWKLPLRGVSDDLSL